MTVVRKAPVEKYVSQSNVPVIPMLSKDVKNPNNNDKLISISMDARMEKLPLVNQACLCIHDASIIITHTPVSIDAIFNGWLRDEDAQRGVNQSKETITELIVPEFVNLDRRCSSSDACCSISCICFADLSPTLAP